MTATGGRSDSAERAVLIEPGRIDLVVTDLDGTLWDRSNVVHPLTVRAVRRLQDAGVRVLAASGRRPASIKKVLGANDLTMAAVCLDGALGRDFDTNEDFHRSGFVPELALDILERFLSAGIEPVVNIAARDDRDCVLGSSPSTHPDHVNNTRDWTRRADLHRIVSEETVLGFGLCGQPEEVIQRCKEALHAGLDLTSGSDTQYGGHGLAVRPPGVNKWSGVVAYCHRHDIATDRVLAVGDGHNDRELLANAAIACAVMGGDPELIRQADHVIGPPSAGGWSELDWTTQQ